MKLAAQKIPAKFIQAMPRGLRLVKKDGGDFLLVESAFCPKGHNLVVDSVRIHDEASIKLKITIRGESGLIYVDSFWGSHAKLFSFIPLLSGADEAFVGARCPVLRRQHVREVRLSSRRAAARSSRSVSCCRARRTPSTCARGSAARATSSTSWTCRAASSRR